MSTAIDREALKAHARASAFDTGRACDHCDGHGRMYPGRRVIHTRTEHGFGADWDEAAVIEAIDKAVDLQWGRGLFGPHLVLTRLGGARLAIEIPPMDEDAA